MHLRVVFFDSMRAPTSFFCSYKTLVSIRIVLSHSSSSRMFFKMGRCLTRGGQGGGLSCPFPKIRKNCPNFGGKCPDCGYLWVKFLIQNTIFQSFQAKNNGNFFPVGPFFLVLQVNVYQSDLNPRKLPCPKTLLVMRLRGMLIKDFSKYGRKTLY